jgi:hypothetical protein
MAETLYLLRLPNAMPSGKGAYLGRARDLKGMLYSPLHGMWATTRRSLARVFTETQAAAWMAKYPQFRDIKLVAVEAR